MTSADVHFLPSYFTYLLFSLLCSLASAFYSRSLVLSLRKTAVSFCSHIFDPTQQTTFVTQPLDSEKEYVEPHAPYTDSKHPQKEAYNNGPPFKLYNLATHSKQRFNTSKLQQSLRFLTSAIVPLLLSTSSSNLNAWKAFCVCVCHTLYLRAMSRHVQSEAKNLSRG